MARTRKPNGEQPATSRAKGRSKTHAVMIDPAIGAALERVAQEATLATGKRVTIRAVVESALLATHPEIRLEPGVVSADVDPNVQLTLDAPPVVAPAPVPPPVTPVIPPDPGAYLMDQILMALLASGDEIEQNMAIERLDGMAIGSYGQEIRLANLAYHLRGTMQETNGPAIGTLVELIKDYENVT